MFRRRLIRSCLVLGLTTGAGCARDIELDPNPPSPDNLGAVVAQFDPSNPVDVLQLVPSPTGLAENPDGTLNQDMVAPDPCELPSTKQCLQFVQGWPLSTPITLYFSGNVDTASVMSGVSLYGLQADGHLRKIGLTFADPSMPIMERPRPPSACERTPSGATRYTMADIPPGIQVVLVPTEPLMARTKYFLAVESTDAGGLRDADGHRVEPSALFSLLNVGTDVAPVTADGEITSALLRSQVETTILTTYDGNGDGVLDFGGKEVTQLEGEEKTKFEQVLTGYGLQLRQLFQFFTGIGDKLTVEGVLANRKDAVFLNEWTTGGETELEFDPANNKFPFPNLPLMTRTSTGGGIMVYLPPDPADSPTAAALKRGLNTLDGFSNTAPIAITFTRNLDESTLADHIEMHLVDDEGVADPDLVPLTLTYTASSSFGPPTVTLRPLMPLLQDQMYVVAVTSGILDEDGIPVVAASTFQILRDVDQPFTSNPIPPKAEQAFQCSTVETTGALADPTTVQGLAMQLETQANHPRWTQSVEAITTGTTGITRSELLMAFLYKTQTITETVDAVKNVLLPNVWEQLDGTPRVVGPIIDVVGTASIAALIGVVPNFCVGFCEAGAMLPDIMPADCATRDAEGNITSVNPGVPGNLVCQLAHQVIVGNLAEARLYLMKGYRATVGSPFAAGTFTPATIMQPEVIDLPFWVITSANPMPANGYPVAIFQHGLGQEKENGFLIANTLANTGDGWATVMIDFPFHGDRASDLINNMTGAPCVDQNGVPDVDPALVACDPQTGMCQGGCDGLQDPSATGLLSPNLFGVRDNFRQGTIDQLTVLRTLQTEGRAGGLLPDLDGTRVGYIGQSLGGIAGGNFAAYVRPDEVQAVVLNVGGGSLTNVVLNTVPQISAPLYAALAQAGVCEFNVEGNPASGCQPTQDFRQFLLIAQWVLDPGDPLGTSIGTLYDRSLVTPGGTVTIPPLGPENILMQMSRPDPVVPNSSSLLLGLAYDFDLDLTTDPFTSNDTHFAIYDFTGLPQATMGSGCHGFLLAPTCGAFNEDGTPNLPDILCNTAGAQIQAAGFLESSGTVVPPKRPGQVSGIPCP